MEFRTFNHSYKEEFITTLRNLDEKILENVLNEMERAREHHKQIFILGNGGSATTSSHWVCDFLKGVNFNDSLRYKIYSLTDNQSIFSALANDFSYENVFVEQLKNYLEEGDLVIGLSVSGNSPNLIQALSYSRNQGATTISLIGDYDGAMKDFSDYALIIPSKNYGIVEDVHMYIGHIISQYVYKVNKETGRQIKEESVE